MKYLAVEPLSFSTSSSIREKTAFFSSSPAATNSFTKASKLSTIPAYQVHKHNTIKRFGQQQQKD